MMTAIAVLGMTLMPMLAVAVLLGLAAWRDRVREATVARQIRLTDAIAGELGAIVAPVVTKRLWRPWQVRIAVPVARPAAVARIVSIAHRMLETLEPGRYELVLTPQESFARAGGPAVVTELRRRIA